MSSQDNKVTIGPNGRVQASSSARLFFLAIPLSGKLYILTEFAHPFILRTYNMRLMRTSLFGLLLTLCFGGGVAAAASISLTPVNGPGTYPYLGFVVGPANSNDNLSVGSYNYELLTEANYSAPGAVPTAGGNAYSSADDETSVFTISGDSIGAQWINTDGSSPTTIVWYLPSANGLLLTGDGTAFNNYFPGGYEVDLTYVPTTSTTGDIQVTNAGTSALVGYVSDAYVSTSLQRLGVTTDTADALIIQDPTAASTPEPASLALIGVGTFMTFFARKRFARSQFGRSEA